MFGFQGPNLAIVTACTTGLHSIGMAGRMIEHGDADVMIAGGSEATVSPLGVGGFAAARALSTRNDDPATASRPWDKDRDGFVLGEGAGVLVLEEYEHAKRRGAKIYAELVGFGMGADAFHMTAPNVDGPKRSMLAALRSAGVNADQIQYLNAHGTSTPLGDVNETNAIKLAFGDHARKLVVNSTKSMTGHLLGGAGGIESVFTVLALQEPGVAADHQHLQPGSRVRPGLLRQHGARDEDRVRRQEQLRLRWHQRHAGLQAGLTPPAGAHDARRSSCAIASSPCLVHRFASGAASRSSRWRRSPRWRCGRRRGAVAARAGRACAGRSGRTGRPRVRRCSLVAVANARRGAAWDGSGPGRRTARRSAGRQPAAWQLPIDLGSFLLLR